MSTVFRFFDRYCDPHLLLMLRYEGWFTKNAASLRSDSRIDRFALMSA